MAIYDIDGNELSTVFNIDGERLNAVYDVDGNPLNIRKSIAVMTFNIQWWSGINANESLMNSIFSAYQPLVCGIQETGSSGTLQYIGAQFQSGKAMTNVPNKPAFLFNTEYSDYTEGVYQAQGSETRGWQKCSIVIDGKTVSFFNTHLQNDAPSIRIPQALELLDMLLEEEYFVCTGDFNFGGTSVSDEQYVNMVQPFIDAGCNMANWSARTGLVDTWFNGSTVSGSTQKFATDNIITSSNIAINEIIFDQRKIEANTGLVLDHIPIVAYLTIN